MSIEKALAIEGWMKEDELLWLAAAAAKASTIVEVGSYKGRSTRALADNCSGVVYAVDPWSGTYFQDNDRPHSLKTDQLQTFIANMAPHCETGRVVPVKSDLEQAVRLGPLAHVKADLVFIDGDHRQAAVALDIENALRILKRGGVMSGHDYGKSSWPGVKKAVDSYFAGKKPGLCRTIWWLRV
jgi:hypothetical protein